MNNHPSSRQNIEPLMVKLSPLVWVSGLSSVAYQLATAGALLRSNGRLNNLTLIQSLILAYCIVYTASISWAAIQGAEFIRVLAALYNLSIWVMGAIIFSTQGGKHEQTRKSSRLILTILLTLCIISYFLFAPRGSVRLSSLLGLVINADLLPENLAANTNLHFTSADWSTLGLGARLSIMSPYPTALGMLALMLLTLAAPSDWSAKNLYRYAYYVAACLIISFLSASRAAMGCTILFVGLLSIFYVMRSMKSQNFKFFVISTLIATLAAATLGLGDRAASAWTSINATRAESSTLRFDLYTKSVTAAIEEHPIIGFGVKERTNVFAIPLGSHSTLFGAMYKTGALGLLTVLAFFIGVTVISLKVAINSASLYRAALGAGCISMIPLLVFEDIDAIPLVAYLFFLSIAMMERKSPEPRNVLQAHDINHDAK
ncbi:O-antigen ligase family protein [Stenotrophomonas sp. PUT21]|uniref:O-antigen ligase family protein n=1 Tax=Stenotrophomonas sp. PUT21 TaxID=3456954 RepID=UPI003FCDB605